MTESLLVHEIYLSIQGESTFAGLPCAFDRLTGCDLRCSYCDTVYAFKGGKPAEAIALTVTKRLLAEGFILLPEGEPANILSITPPLTVGKTHIARFTRALGQALEDAYS